MPDSPGQIIHDARALLGDRAAPQRPDYGPSVAQALGAMGGLVLTLRATKKVKTYEAWLWEDGQGRAYYSKRLASGRTLAWATHATIERVKQAAGGMRWAKPDGKPFKVRAQGTDTTGESNV